MTSGFLECTGSSTCSPPTRFTSCARAPPDDATSARPPAATTAWAISMVPRSTPPPAPRAGTTCRMVANFLSPAGRLFNAAIAGGFGRAAAVLLLASSFIARAYHEHTTTVRSVDGGRSGAANTNTRGRRHHRLPPRRRPHAGRRVPDRLPVRHDRRQGARPRGGLLTKRSSG